MLDDTTAFTDEELNKLPIWAQLRIKSMQLSILCLMQTKQSRRLADCRGFVEIINSMCSCGGGDPEQGCEACKIYHAIKDWKVAG